MKTIYGNCIDINGNGIIILGKSGTGKSDITYRLICNHGAKLVSDDHIIIEKNENELVAKTVENIKGLIEIRNIGIIKTDYLEKTNIKLIIELEEKENLERMPENEFLEINNIKIKKIKLNAFEQSSELKIITALKIELGLIEKIS
jgi:HPr kinase/phosphorylase